MFCIHAAAAGGGGGGGVDNQLIKLEGQLQNRTFCGKMQ